MTSYYYYIPVYIPVDDNSVTGPEAVGLIILLIIFFVWAVAVILLFGRLVFDDGEQDKKRHTIELIALIAIGIAGVIWLIMC